MVAPGEARRKQPLSKRARTGMLGPYRRVWVKFGGFQVKVDIRPEGSSTELLKKEVGENVVIGISSSKMPEFAIFLSPYTEEEIISMKAVFDMAFAAGIEVAKRRDRVAARAALDGDYTYPRMLREAPSIYVREGEQFEPVPYLSREVVSDIDPTEFEFDFESIKQRAKDIISKKFKVPQEIALSEEDAHPEEEGDE